MLLQNMSLLTHLSVVDGIEECHAANQQLEEWSNAHLLGLHILVLPPPPGSAEGSSDGLRRLIPASQP